MVVVTPESGLFSYNTRGRMGKPNGLGVMFLGWNDLGLDDDRCGTYQKHRTKKNKVTVKLWQNWPTNNKKTAQQAWRDVFKAGMLAWASLTPAEQWDYNHDRRAKHMTGKNLFLRKYLKSH